MVHDGTGKLRLDFIFTYLFQLGYSSFLFFSLEHKIGEILCDALCNDLDIIYIYF